MFFQELSILLGTTEEVINTIKLYCRKCRDKVFYWGEEKANFTIYRACEQKSPGALEAKMGISSTGPDQHRQKNYSRELLGERN